MAVLKLLRDPESDRLTLVLTSVTPEEDADLRSIHDMISRVMCEPEQPADEES